MLSPLWQPPRQASHLGQIVMPLLTEEDIKARFLIKPGRGCGPYTTFTIYQCVLALLLLTFC